MRRKAFLIILVILIALFRYQQHYNSPNQQILRIAHEHDIPREIAKTFYRTYTDLSSEILHRNKSMTVHPLKLFSQDEPSLAYLNTTVMSFPGSTWMSVAKCAQYLLHIQSKGVGLNDKIVHLIGTLIGSQTPGGTSASVLKQVIRDESLFKLLEVFDEFENLDNSTPSRTYENLLQLTKHVPELLDYPKELEAVAIQATLVASRARQPVAKLHLCVKFFTIQMWLSI